MSVLNIEGRINVIKALSLGAFYQKHKQEIEKGFRDLSLLLKKHYSATTNIAALLNKTLLFNKEDEEFEKALIDDLAQNKIDLSQAQAKIKERFS